MKWLLMVIGIVELLEGLIIFLYPQRAKEALRFWLELAELRFRLPAIAPLAIGLILIWIGLSL